METRAEQRRACHAAVHDALADADPWHGFRNPVERICGLHAHSRGFADAFPEAMDFAAGRERTPGAAGEPARRAQETGRSRPGFVVDDLILMPWPTGASGTRRAPPGSRPPAASPPT